jgi:hypothetical protein
MLLSEQEGKVGGETVNASVKTFVDVSLPGKFNKTSLRLFRFKKEGFISRRAVLFLITQLFPIFKFRHIKTKMHVLY